MPPQLPTAETLARMLREPHLFAEMLVGLLGRLPELERKQDAILERQAQILQAVGRLERKLGEVDRRTADQGETWLSSVDFAEAMQMTRGQLIALADRHPELRALAEPPAGSAPPGAPLRWPLSRAKPWVEQHRQKRARKGTP